MQGGFAELGSVLAYTSVRQLGFLPHKQLQHDHGPKLPALLCPSDPQE